jgi:hypothetical protein
MLNYNSTKLFILFKKLEIFFTYTNFNLKYSEERFIYFIIDSLR